MQSYMRSILFIFFFINAGISQVIFRPGKFRNEVGQADAEDVPTISMRSQDNLMLSQELRSVKFEDSSKGPYTFGKLVTPEQPIDLTQEQFLKNKNSSSKVWRLKIKSSGALSLSVKFRSFQLSSDLDELYIVGKSDVMGPFTSQNNKDNLKFSVAPIKGDFIVLELYSSAEKPLIEIDSIVHGFRPIGRSGPCNVDSKCNKEWQDQSHSVAMILTESGTGYCSGAMINNLRNDGRQLFLTANHCVGGDMTDDIVMFNYEAEACSARSRPSNKHTAHGLKLLSSFGLSDFALFEVIERIPETYNAYLSGWSADLYPPQSPVGIHHPSADIKKISFSQNNATGSCWGGTCGRRLEDHWKIHPWSKGTTEPGSSGSPLFEGISKRIVGQLHGGSASCWNTQGYDLYGKLASSWIGGGSSKERLQDHLDPDNSGKLWQDGRYLYSSSDSLLEQF